MKRCVPAMLLLALFSTACHDSNSSSTSPSTTTTDTFSSILQVSGADYQSFTVTTGGTFTVTLTSLSNTANTIGLGVGIPSVTGRGCYVTQSLTTAGGSGAQISANVDAGIYCVTVYDEGRLTDRVSFSVSIEHT